MAFAAAFAISISVGAVSGYIQRNRNTGEKISDKIKEVALEEETLIKNEKAVTHYIVTLNESCIVLQEVFDDETKNELERVAINTSVLPKNDVKVLSEGVAFTDKEEALILIENFVS